MREAFRPKNEFANQAKGQSHVAGFWAVAAALAALSGAALEPVWGHLEAPWPRVIAIVSAALGLGSFLLAAFVLAYGKRKATWLYTRLFTERLRQFHFQAFVWRLPEIADSLRSKSMQSDYCAKREEWLATFQSDFEGKGNVRLAAILHPTANAPVWVNPPNPSRDDPDVPTDIDLNEVFRAYQSFRFDEQQGYAEYMLRQLNRPDPAKVTELQARRSSRPWYPGVDLPLKAKRNLLQNVFISSLGLLVLLHIGIMVSHLGNLHFFGGPVASRDDRACCAIGDSCQDTL